MSLQEHSPNVEASLAQRIRKLRLIAFDFDGVFTDNMVYVLQDGNEAVRCSRADGLGLRKLGSLGIEPVIISMEENPVVMERSKKLKVRCFNGCEDKVRVLESLLKERSISYENTAFLGNDINDIPCLMKVGFPMVVQDAHQDVLPYALYRTKKPGGHGAVREVCDLIEQVLVLEKGRK